MGSIDFSPQQLVVNVMEGSGSYPPSIDATHVALTPLRLRPPLCLLLANISFICRCLFIPGCLSAGGPPRPPVMSWISSHMKIDIAQCGVYFAFVLDCPCFCWCLSLLFESCLASARAGFAFCGMSLGNIFQYLHVNHEKHVKFVCLVKTSLLRLAVLVKRRQEAFTLIGLGNKRANWQRKRIESRSRSRKRTSTRRRAPLFTWLFLRFFPGAGSLSIVNISCTLWAHKYIHLMLSAQFRFEGCQRTWSLWPDIKRSPVQDERAEGRR